MDTLQKQFHIFEQNVLARHNRFLLTSHIYPDGDSFGSEKALYEILRYFNKEVVIVNEFSLSSQYHYLNNKGEFFQWNKDGLFELPFAPEVVIVLDANSWERIGSVKNLVLKENIRYTVCMDHHIAGDSYFDLKIIHEPACATGEIVFELAKFLTVPLNFDMARGIYTAIFTDTGGFYFQNTNANALRIAASCLDAGVDSYQISHTVYEQSSPTRIKLLGDFLLQSQYIEEHSLIYSFLSFEQARQAKVEPEEVSGFVNYLRTTRDTELILFFWEIEKDLVKIEFRSKFYVNVAEIAKYFGGGGHKNSAGALLHGDLFEIMNRVVMAIPQLSGKQVTA